MPKYLIRFIVLIAFVTTAILGEASTMAKSPIKKVMIMVAMESEANPIIATLNLQKLDKSFSNLPMHGYEGKYSNLDILLVTNGTDPVNKVQNVCTQAATLSTFLGIQYFHPDLIISIGTAGGVEQNGAQERDIYVSKKISFYDRRIPIEGYRQYGIGDYVSASFPSIYKKIGLKPGNICSGDSFDTDEKDYNIFIKQDCVAVDMEAAGVAWVSMLTKTPMLAIKGVTNFVKGEDIHEHYEKNLPIVTAELSKQLQALLKNVSLEN